MPHLAAGRVPTSLDTRARPGRRRRSCYCCSRLPPPSCCRSRWFSRPHEPGIFVGARVPLDPVTRGHAPAEACRRKRHRPSLPPGLPAALLVLAALRAPLLGRSWTDAITTSRAAANARIGARGRFQQLTIDIACGGGGGGGGGFCSPERDSVRTADGMMRAPASSHYLRSVPWAWRASSWRRLDRRRQGVVG